MKKLLVLLGLVMILLGLTYMYKDDLYMLYDNYFLKEKVVAPEKNKYYRYYDFDYVKNTDDLEPNTYKELTDLYYTILNTGVSTYSFYCAEEYDSCLYDVERIANDQEVLSNINNFVHPFNSFKHFETVYDDTGKVTINIIKTYSKDRIKEIEEKVNTIKAEIIKDDMSDTDKIKVVHDYIINNSKYDSNRSDYGVTDYESDTAYGPLFEGYSLCGGYTDTMELFLEDFGIKSYRVSSNKHVWNALYLNDKWLNLDLTWDDPVVNTGENRLDYKYYLLETNALRELKDDQHDFDKTVYTELG